MRHHIIALAAFVAAFCPTPTVADQAQWIDPGQTAVLKNGVAGWGCPGTEKGFQDMYDAGLVNDTAGVQEAVNGTGGIALQPGERILALKLGSGSHIRIRIMSGPDAGTACWTDEQEIAPFLKYIRGGTQP